MTRVNKFNSLFKGKTHPVTLTEFNFDQSVGSILFFAAFSKCEVFWTYFYFLCTHISRSCFEIEEMTYLYCGIVLVVLFSPSSCFLDSMKDWFFGEEQQEKIDGALKVRKTQTQFEVISSDENFLKLAKALNDLSPLDACYHIVSELTNLMTPNYVFEIFESSMFCSRSLSYHLLFFDLFN